LIEGTKDKEYPSNLSGPTDKNARRALFGRLNKPQTWGRREVLGYALTTFTPELAKAFALTLLNRMVELGSDDALLEIRPAPDNIKLPWYYEAEFVIRTGFEMFPTSFTSPHLSLIVAMLQMSRMVRVEGFPQEWDVKPKLVEQTSMSFSFVED
jgi:hypothetical protein